MNTNRATAGLVAVQHNIVRLGAHLAGVAVHQCEILVLGRGEWVVDCIPALLVGVPFYQRKIDDPAERQARDEALRAIFADPDLRHHEAVAEAELDIDYGGSPIVMGDRHDALAPGQRLPDTIEVRLADASPCMLHELANRAGHTALLIGGSSIHTEALARVDSFIRPQILASVIIEAIVVIAAGADDQSPYARITPIAAEQLGIGEITLLVIRPDGHIGLRSDRNHVEDLTAYQQLLVSGQT